LTGKVKTNSLAQKRHAERATPLIGFECINRLVPGSPDVCDPMVSNPGTNKISVPSRTVFGSEELCQVKDINKRKDLVPGNIPEGDF
jgi:hypothetical protein